MCKTWQRYKRYIKTNYRPTNYPCVAKQNKSFTLIHDINTMTIMIIISIMSTFVVIIKYPFTTSISSIQTHFEYCTV